MPEALSDGIRISYDDQGQGEPALLFMPGWCGSRKVFDPLVSRCATYRRTLALDWRGHGESESTTDDFGAAELIEDALAVIKASRAEEVIPVALAHAGWTAIELRRRLGSRIPKLILLDWIILEAPSPFLEVLSSLQDRARWQPTRDRLFSMWLQDSRNPAMLQYVREDMGSYSFEMWARAARTIRAAYLEAGSPLQALANLEPFVPVLHMYAQPDDPGYLSAQRSFGASAHPWFQVSKIGGRTHFPMYEMPAEMAMAIEKFAQQ